MGYTKSFFREMSDLKEYAYETRNKEVAKMYKELHTFVLDGSYSSVKSAPKLVKLIDMGLSEQAKAKAMSITGDTVRNKTRTISMELFSLFGRDFFSKLKSGDVVQEEECRRIIFSVMRSCRSSSDYVLDEVKIQTGYSPRNFNPDFTVDDCKRELAFLGEYSRTTMLGKMQDLSISKLNYLMCLLDGKGDRNEQYEVFSYFEEIGGMK